MNRYVLRLNKMIIRTKYSCCEHQEFNATMCIDINDAILKVNGNH